MTVIDFCLYLNLLLSPLMLYLSVKNLLEWQKAHKSWQESRQFLEKIRKQYEPEDNPGNEGNTFL